MIIINNPSNDPYFNLSVEEYYLLNSDEDIFILWQNRPVAVIGKNQNVYAEINIPYAESNNITIVRRITGGGAVYHDLGNVNYTFITSREKADSLDFTYFTKPIISALSEYGIEAKLSGRNDIMTNGAKFSGNAQHSTDSRILHHGTLLFDCDLSVMPNLLTVDEDKIKSKAIKSVRSRVINLKPLFSNPNITVLDFISLIKKYVKLTYSATEHDISSIERIDIEKICKRYSSWDWTFYKKDAFENRSKKYFQFGLVDINYSVKNGLISDIKVCGDFFGTADIVVIESLLKGKAHNKTDINKLFEKCNIGDFIGGMKNEEFINMLFV